MKFSRNFILVSMVLVILISVSYGANSASAATKGSTYFTDCSLNISMVNQDPYPAQPDSYVTVVFQVKWNNFACNGTRFELLPSYPFSLDQNDSLRILPTDTIAFNTYSQDFKKEWMIPYKLRVDKNALDGDTEVKVLYSPGIWEEGTPMSKIFNITVQDARTNFDAVLQQVQGTEVSIAIANSGKYAANSVVVRMPEQQDFRVIGTDGQMVGNLQSGDYTVVGFSIAPASQFSARNQSAQRNFTQFRNATGNATARNLKFDIYYTDNIGQRRIVNMELPYSAQLTGNSTGFSAGNGNGTRRTSSSSSGTPIIIALVIMVAVLLAYIIFFRKPKHKTESHRGETPEWIKNSKVKEKGR